MKKQTMALLTLVTISLYYLIGCSGGSTPSDPKGVVVAMFGAMEKDDKATLAHLLDLVELMHNPYEDYSLQMKKPRVFTNPEEILDDLTNDGLTKQRWFSHQRIINKVDVSGETATVEVTFLDKNSSRAYLTKFGLHVVNGKWKIYSFKTNPSGE